MSGCILLLQEVTSSFACSYLNSASAVLADDDPFQDAEATAACTSLLSSPASSSSRETQAQLRSRQTGVVFGSKMGAVCGLAILYNGGIGSGSSSTLRLLSSSCVALKDALQGSLSQLVCCLR